MSYRFVAHNHRLYLGWGGGGTDLTHQHLVLTECRRPSVAREVTQTIFY